MPTEADVLVIGEALIDVVVTAEGVREERPGGSAANVAVALARLGRDVRFATALGRDPHGELVAGHLDEAAVTLATDPYTLDRTSTAVATLGADGSASYEFDLDWRWGPLGDERPRAVHVCSLGAVLEPGCHDVVDALDRLAATGATIVYDVNARPVLTGAGEDVVERTEAVVRRAEVVKASDEDLSALWPGRSMAEAANHLRSLGPKVVVVTSGAEGSSWFGDGQVVHAAPHPAEVVDTIGAGDTFSAAIIDALLSGLAPADVLDHAARASAVTVSRRGADPPTRADLYPGVGK